MTSVTGLTIRRRGMSAVALCGAQLWLVVPQESVLDAQAHLCRHGLDPRVGGYGRDAAGAMRLEWW